MDLENTFSTIAASLPEDLDRVIHQAASYIPQELSDVIWHTASYLPTEISLISAAEFLLYFAAAALILGVIGRVVLGKRSSLNHALSTSMGIAFIYAMTIVIYTFKPWNLELLLSPLPFVSFSGDYLIMLPITDLQFPALCTELLSLVILAFLINLLDTFMPKGEGILSWFLLRLMTVLLCFGLHILVSWAFRTYLPEVLVTYAPVVLLILLAFMLFSGILSLVLGLIIAISNPYLGAMYTFFFSSAIGKQVSKAIFTSAVLCVVFYLMDQFGYIVIMITPAALLTYIPLAIVMVILWYLIGHIL